VACSITSESRIPNGIRLSFRSSASESNEANSLPAPEQRRFWRIVRPYMRSWTRTAGALRRPRASVQSLLADEFSSPSQVVVPLPLARNTEGARRGVFGFHNGGEARPLSVAL